jgi:hypothetical protein
MEGQVLTAAQMVFFVGLLFLLALLYDMIFPHE